MPKPKPDIEFVHTVTKTEWDAVLGRIADLERHTHQYYLGRDVYNGLVETTSPVGGES